MTRPAPIPALRLCTVQLDVIPWLRTQAGAWWPAEPLLTATGDGPPPGLTVGELFAREHRQAYRAVEGIAAEAAADRLDEVLPFLTEKQVDLAVLPEYALPVTCLPKLIDYARDGAIVAGLEYVRNARTARLLAEFAESDPAAFGPDDLLGRNVSVLVAGGTVTLVTKHRLSQPEYAAPGTGVRYADIMLKGRQVRVCVAVCMDYLHLSEAAALKVDVVCVPALTPALEPFLPRAPRDFVTVLANVAHYGGSRIIFSHVPDTAADRLGPPAIAPGYEGVIVVDFDDFVRKPSGLRRTENALAFSAEIIEDDAAHARKVQAVRELADPAWHRRSLEEQRNRVSARLGEMRAAGPLAQTLAAYLGDLAQDIDNRDAYGRAANHLVIRPGNAPAAVRHRQARFALELLTGLPGGGRGRAVDAYTAAAGRPPQVRVLTEPPSFAPVRFQDRVQTLEELENALARKPGVVVALAGDGGYGKTALVARVKEDLEEGRGELRAEVFGYLSASGYRLINSATLLEELAEANPDVRTRDELAECLNDPSLTWPDKLAAVVAALGRTRVLVVLDQLEKLLTRRGQFRDASLEDTIRDIAAAGGHRIKLLLVSSVRPCSAKFDIDVVPLDRGLPSTKYTKELFLDFARNGPAWRGARLPDEVFDRLHQITDGHTRAVELVFAALTISPGTAMPVLLDSLGGPGGLVPKLLDHIMANLSAPDVAVVRALAVFGRPVDTAALGDVLHGHVTAEDAGSALDRHTGTRLIRRDGTRFYLPPDPDGVHILRGIPPGTPADLEADPQPLTRRAMLHRAANHFATRTADPVRRLAHLAPHFSEIDLRLQGGEHLRALELMNHLDGTYLSKWGYSDALSTWRRGLARRLTGHKSIHNGSALANALAQRGDIGDALAVVDGALSRNHGDDLINEIELLLQRAGLLYQDGRISDAESSYRKAEGSARPIADRKYVARAWDGIGLCCAETGRLDAARTHFRAALAAIGQPTAATEPPLRELVAELLLNYGVLAGLRGESGKALAVIRRAKRVALDHPLLGAKCLDAEAVVLLSGQRTEAEAATATATALDLAEEAARRGASAGNPELSRRANGTLALALLRRGRDAQAFAAAASAARYDRSRLVLGAQALKGLTALRISRADDAVLAFREVDRRAGELLSREHRWYQVWDTRGLALCGLTLCGADGTLDRAVSAYRVARGIESAPGVVDRALGLLDDLAAGPGGTVLGPARDAAGRPFPER